MSELQGSRDIDQNYPKINIGITKRQRGTSGANQPARQCNRQHSSAEASSSFLACSHVLDLNMGDEGVSVEEPVTRKTHRTDVAATKLVEKTDNLHEKANKLTIKNPEMGPDHKEGPAGGFDETAIPQAPPGYTVKFTFHSADNLPVADINTLSSDPYVLAQVNTELPKRHKKDPYLRFRTPTIRRSTHPEWNCEWIVANIPASGFKLKCRIYDEDPADHDDRLGTAEVIVNGIGEDWSGIDREAFRIKKRKASKRAYVMRSCAAMFSSQINMTGNLIISVQALGRTDTDNGGRMWTVGPCAWSRHWSPMIGRLAGTKEPGKGKKGATEMYNFQANQLQLAGPVPPALYHRYVEFKPFVAGMFNARSLRGRILNRALHHQHARVYNYDRSTVYGSFPSPCKEMTIKFLELVHYDQGGRIYTYILSLDGQWRFTETGKEFGIDLLSKHTMHSDVSIYIAFSGEFFIRRFRNPKKDADDQPTHPAEDIDGGPPHDTPPQDPAFYELIIDNDSGTYRPNPKLLPQLKAFMSHNLPGLKIKTLDCTGDKDKMDKMKTQQRERKKAEGPNLAIVQHDGGSISSSDEEDLDEHAHANTNGGTGKENGGTLKKLGHEIMEPKAKIMQWADPEREKKKTDDDEAVMRSQGQR